MAATLTYFTLPGVAAEKGARGFVTRVCMRASGQPFVDTRVTFAEWAALKAKAPLGQLPTLEVGGEVLTQSVP